MTTQNHTQMPCIIILPLWGQSFITDFFETSFHSWLAPHNLPYFSKRNNIELAIITNDENVENIKENLNKFNISDYCNTNFYTDKQQSDNKKPYLSQRIEKVLNQSFKYQKPICYILTTSDIIYSKNCFSTVYEMASQGVEAALTINLRCSKTIARQAAIDRINSTGILNYTNRELTQLGLNSLSNLNISYFWKNSVNLKHQTPPMNLWHAGTNCVGALTYLRHPFMFVLKRPITKLSGPIDFTILDDAGIKNENVYRFKNSDELSFIELIEENTELDLIRDNCYEIEFLNNYANQWFVRSHYENLRTPFLFIKGKFPKNSPEYLDWLVQSKSIASQILKNNFKKNEGHKTPLSFSLIGSLSYLKLLIFRSLLKERLAASTPKIIVLDDRNSFEKLKIKMPKLNNEIELNSISQERITSDVLFWGEANISNQAIVESLIERVETNKLISFLVDRNHLETTKLPDSGPNIQLAFNKKIKLENLSLHLNRKIVLSQKFLYLVYDLARDSLNTSKKQNVIILFLIRFLIVMTSLLYLLRLIDIKPDENQDNADTFCLFEYSVKRSCE